MFKKIIAAVDGEQGGLDASALAKSLAAPGAELVVARVVVQHGRAQGVADAGEDEAVSAARRAIAGAPGERDVVSSVGVLVHAPSVVAGLRRLAEEQSVDVLVVGSHHRGGSGHLWSADRTRATLRDAPCPVAVAPRGYADGSHEPIRSVGVGYDDDAESRAALAAAKALARATGADVRITHVVPESNWESPDSGAGRRAVAARERLADLEGLVNIVEGDVHDALTALARDVDLLVLGSHHHGVLRRLVLGDTVAGLAGALACPVLVMPHVVSRSTTARA